jgi:hypothetical protein
LGLVITIVGFGLALWRIRKSEAASEQARRAAEAVRAQILLLNAVQGLHDTIAALEDIRRLHRLQAWPALPDRYSVLKRNLIAIRSRTPNLTIAQRSEIQATIQQLSNMETQIENAIEGSDHPDVPRMNKIVARQFDRLALILIELQRDIERYEG